MTSPTIPNSVTSIGDNAFAYCYLLSSVIIPNSVTSIGEGAFFGCSGLKKSAYPNTLSNPFSSGFAVAYEPEGAIIEDGFIWGPEKSSILFAPYTLTEEYTIPNSVTSIEADAFKICSSLTSITIPNSVKSIGRNAFYNCSKLTEINLQDGNTDLQIGNEVFNGSPITSLYMGRNCSISDNSPFASSITNLTIGASVTSIGSSAFKGNYGLTSIDIPNSVTSIGSYAFSGCSKLTEIKLQDGNVELQIETKVFNGSPIRSLYMGRNCSTNDNNAIASGITNLTIGASVTSIGSSAFRDCTGLKSITIPSSITSIGSSAFSGCSELSSVTIPNSVTFIGAGAFNGCRGLESVIIPSSVTSIGSSTFSGCSKLSSVTIPNSVTFIGAGAFNGCRGLASVIIPSSVTSIGNYAFSGCSELTSVIIPNSVRSLGEDVFYGCSSLKKSAYPNTLSNPFSDGIAIEYNPKSALIEDGFIWGPEKSSILFAPCSLTREFVIPKYVSSIGSRAFYLCNNITGITTLTEMAPIMPNDAFEGLYENAALSFPKSAVDSYLGSNWSLFKSLRFNNSDVALKNYSDGILDYWLLGAESETDRNIAVVKKGNYESMTSVTIPERFSTEDSERYYVNSIGYGAFSGCSNLSEVRFHNKSALTSIGDDAFKGTRFTSISLPSSVTSIGRGAFMNSQINSFTIPESIDSIADETFSGCNLQSIEIPAQVILIGKSAFANCPNLNKMTVLSSNSTLVIEENAFFNSNLYYLDIDRNWTNKRSISIKSLVEVKIGPKVNSLSDFAFSGCSNLKSLEIPRTITSIGCEAFSNSGLTSITIPNSVDSIAEGAFYGCPSLSSIKLSAGLKTIADNAFANCKLSNLVLPPCVENIEDNAFANNATLNVVAMGPNVKSIGDKAFDKATLDKVFITAPTPPTAPYTAFSRYAAKLYLQGEATVNAYYDAPTCWDRFEGFSMSEPTNLTIIAPKEIELKAGNIFTLNTSLTPSNVDLPYIFWRSTDSKKAYVDNDGVVTILQDITEDDNVKIIAETLYHNGPTAEFLLDINSSDIISIDGDSATSLDVYTLQGVLVLRNATSEQFNNLSSGTYIVRSGKKVKKIMK